MALDRSIAVVGTGTVGAMALWQLASRGVTDLHGFDTYAPGHDRGGYGGQTRIFRVAYKEGTQYVPLLLRAKDLWQQLERDSDTNLLTFSGGLSIGPGGHPDLENVLECIQEFDLPHERLTAQQARTRFPHLPLTEGEEAVLDHSAGVLRPEQSIIAAADQARQQGAELHTYTSITGLEADEDGVTLRTAAGERRFDHVILSPGPWSRELLELSTLPLSVHQITTLWFLARNPQAFSPETSPIVIRAGEIAFSCFPAVDGETVKVSLHSLPRPHLNSAEKVDRNPDDRYVAAVREAVEAFLPDLVPDPVRIGSYADSFTPDNHAVIGSLPNLPNVTVATGLSAHGFKLAPTFGEIVADLATTGETEHDIDHLTPTRFF